MSTTPTTLSLSTQVVDRIHARDSSLWPAPETGSDLDWLGWLELPNALRDGVGLPSQNDLEQLADTDHVVVLGMGGSSLTALVLADIFNSDRSDAPSKKLTVLDTCNPITVRDFLRTTDLRHSHFLVSSKSGTTIEPLSLEAIFREELANLGEKASPRFTAITDADTPLARRAADQAFRAHTTTPDDVGGRFSALSAFGMYPAALCGMPTEAMATNASEMYAKCREASESNPGYALGKFLAENAASGRDKLTVVTTDSLKMLGTWLEQLIAESTGKRGTGLVPISGEPPLRPPDYGEDRQFVRISLASDATSAFHHQLQPVYDIVLNDPAEISGEFFRWEFAVAVASAGLGVYPFDQPNVESAKQYARQVLDEGTEPDLKTMSLSDALGLVSRLGANNRYIALCAFLPESDELNNAFSNLRRAISRTTKMATTFGYGPRYLHSTGQLHKGGPDSVIQVVLVQDHATHDLAVPGTGYTLAQLNRAQALGDVMAMHNLGRDSLLVSLDEPVEELEAAVASW